MAGLREEEGQLHVGQGNPVAVAQEYPVAKLHFATVDSRIVTLLLYEGSLETIRRIGASQYVYPEMLASHALESAHVDLDGSRGGSGLTSYHIVSFPELKGFSGGGL